MQISLKRIKILLLSKPNPNSKSMQLGLRLDTKLTANHIVPIARLEAFRPLKASKLEAFRGLKPYSQIGGF